MEVDDMTMEEKAEILMNVVVESRKRFGKMSIDYDNKCQVMENKMLSLQLKTTANYHFKSKSTPQTVDIDNLNKEIEDFNTELLRIEQKRQYLRKQIENTKSIVKQLKSDAVGKKIRQPLTAEAMLARAKQKL